MDWNPTADNAFLLEGGGYGGGVDEMFTVYDPASPTLSDMAREDMRVGGADVLGRWTHAISDTTNWKLQAYYDFTTRDTNRVFDEQRNTFGLTFQNEFAADGRNQAIWGLGYRVTADTEKDFPAYSFYPAGDTLNLFSAFAQDEITLVPDRLKLTLGSKLEHNDYTGVEIEPGARLLWTLTERQTFWASVSRAVRTPSRSEESILLYEPNQPAPGTVAEISGNPHFQSEEMLAYEIGYRAVPADNLSLDAAVFFNNYDHLRSLEFSSFSPGLPPADSMYLANNLYGDTYGTEISATWRVTPRWRLQPAYTFLKMNLHAQAGSTDTTDPALLAGQSPENQFSLQSFWNLPHGVSAYAGLRYVDSLPSIGISSYFELDARLAWRINRHWEVAVVGQNLLHPQHQEFAPSEIPIQQTEIPRSVLGTVTWQF